MNTLKAAVARAKAKTWSDTEVLALILAVTASPFRAHAVPELRPVLPAVRAFMAADAGSVKARRALKRVVRAAVPLRVGAA